VKLLCIFLLSESNPLTLVVTLLNMDVTAAKKTMVRLEEGLDGLLPVGDSHIEDYF
jgi:hypothetical protein